MRVWLQIILVLLWAQSAWGETIQIDVRAPARPFPHYWEQMFGSGRAVLSLRESYRRDLHEVKQATDVGYVRFHGVLDDEVGVYGEDAQGKPSYNFSYVDQIYDGLLAEGVRPFVELSFMPAQLAAQSAVHPFWYHPHPSPPRDWERWGALIEAFARHLIERYGIDEVAKWYFEVWNEPNLDFWSGDPKEATYYQLYDVTARALKRVSPRLRVGGPATAQAAWVDRFIRHCVERKVPVDFVSSHVYANDSSMDVFGTNEAIDGRRSAALRASGRDQMVCRAVKKVHDQIKASARPALPLIFSEYNASYKNEVEITDSPFMGPWLARTIGQCDGLVDNLSYWAFSDVFEEQGVVRRPFYGGYGLMAAGNIPKAAFNAFKLLHQLGDRRLPLATESALATRRADGTLVVAAWNAAASPATLRLELLHAEGQRRARVQIVDGEHGSALGAWEAMGRPDTPTREQQRLLRAAAALPPPGESYLTAGTLTLTLAPQALALIEFVHDQEEGFLEDVEQRAFRYFWEQADPRTGLVLDRARADGQASAAHPVNAASIAATGFGLTALCIAAERGWVPAAAARERVRATLRFFAERAPREHGWFYHWLDPRSGQRVWDSEVSSIDSALLLAGVLTARQAFAKDAEVVRLATQIYEGIDFPWMQNGSSAGLLDQGWTPEHGFLPYRWDTYSEETVLYLLAIGARRHPIAAAAWDAFARPPMDYAGYHYLGIGPLFTHQYSQAFVDYRQRRDRYGDYFENSVTATRAHRAFCLNWGYQGDLWGVTASDSAGGYVAWGGPPPDPRIDGTVVPAAAGGSLMFTPEIAVPALHAMALWGHNYGRYGFVDAFNPRTGWVDSDVVGIDVGITLLSAENLRSGRVWRWFMANAEVQRALAAVGMGGLTL